MDEHDLQLGRVVCVSGSHIVMVWEQPADVEQAAETDRLQKGMLVKLKTPTTVVFALVTGLTIPNPTRSLDPGEAWLAELELIGESDRDGGPFRHGVSAFPTLGDAVWSADQKDLSRIYGQPTTSSITLGTLHSERGGAMHVEPNLLLGRHFAILGSTGCGKSCALTLILRALLDKHDDAHIVLLDPHNEYQTAFGEHAELLGADRLRLPYWTLNSEEIDMVVFGTGNNVPDRSAISEILHELIAEAKLIYQGDRGTLQPLTVNTPTPYRLSDVLRSIDDVMGKLDKPSSLISYKWLKNRLDALTSDPRFTFMFGGITVSDNFADILSQILRIPGNGRPISIIDLSAVPSEVINAVVSVILRLTFDFAHWSRGAQPILLVCEEAHRYAPLDASLGFEPTKTALARIAKEGRKYGLSLCLVSQRPSELATSVLSQCNTSFVFRITSLRDQEIIQGTVADSASGLLDFLPLLGNGEAVVIGDAVSMPVRICFDRLDEEERPQSMTARFSEVWRETPVDKVFVREVVDRWRQHQR
ncbi:MAG: ATP-binding protein [Geminicoccaceae bacterium]